jgi:predicted transcriptional regulator
MPKKNITVWLDTETVGFFDQLAADTRRSRNRVIAMVLEGVAGQKDQQLIEALDAIDCEVLICQK